MSKFKICHVKNPKTGKYFIKHNGELIPTKGTNFQEANDIARKAAVKEGKTIKNYLDDLSLDNFINRQNFKFRKLGYKFKIDTRLAKDGVLDITMKLTNKEGKAFNQGISSISPTGVLENIFIVTLQRNDVSTAMYRTLDKIGFNEVKGLYYGGGDLATNYDEFMKVYKKTKNSIEAAYATPAGKALNRSTNNSFIPKIEVLDELNKKVIVNWIKK